MNPIDIPNKFPNEKEWLLKNKIFAFKEKNWEKEVIIPSFECKVHKWKETFRKYFPFYHQVFWFLCIEFNNLDFAKSEFETFVKGQWIYTFWNGAVYEIIK